MRKNKKIKHSKDKIIVNGNTSIAFGVQNRIIPTGICACSFELPPDQLSNILNNPIKSCIFKKEERGLCYLSGECERKRPLPKNFMY